MLHYCLVHRTSHVTAERAKTTPSNIPATKTRNPASGRVNQMQIRPVRSSDQSFSSKPPKPADESMGSIGVKYLRPGRRLAHSSQQLLVSCFRFFSALAECVQCFLFSFRLRAQIVEPASPSAMDWFTLVTSADRFFPFFSFVTHRSR